MLRKAWVKWQKFGHWIGDQVARIFLVLFYFSIALPFGLLVRLTQDPLDIRNLTRAGWISRETRDKSLENAERTF